jgi:hypothetical protein
VSREGLNPTEVIDAVVKDVEAVLKQFAESVRGPEPTRRELRAAFDAARQSPDMMTAMQQFDARFGEGAFIKELDLAIKREG